MKKLCPKKYKKQQLLWKRRFHELDAFHLLEQYFHGRVDARIVEELYKMHRKDIAEINKELKELK